MENTKYHISYILINTFEYIIDYRKSIKFSKEICLHLW